MEELRSGSDDVDVKYDAESARIEAWLDEHPDFANDYFIRLVLSLFIWSFSELYFN